MGHGAPPDLTLRTPPRCAYRYESAYLNWQYAHYRHFDDGFNQNITMILQSPSVDYASAATQARIAAATADVGASKFVDGASVDSWLEHYLTACAATSGFACTGSGFYAGVDAWLNTEGYAAEQSRTLLWPREPVCTARARAVRV